MSITELNETKKESWASRYRKEYNEYANKFYHEKIATNEEKMAKHREDAKNSMRKLRQKQKEERLSAGIINKRGRPNKIKPLELPREPKKRGRKPKLPLDTSDSNNINLITF